MASLLKQRRVRTLSICLLILVLLTFAAELSPSVRVAGDGRSSSPPEDEVRIITDDGPAASVERYGNAVALNWDGECVGGGTCVGDSYRVLRNGEQVATTEWTSHIAVVDDVDADDRWQVVRERPDAEPVAGELVTADHRDCFSADSVNDFDMHVTVRNEYSEPVDPADGPVSLDAPLLVDVSVFDAARYNGRASPRTSCDAFTYTVTDDVTDGRSHGQVGETATFRTNGMVDGPRTVTVAVTDVFGRTTTLTQQIVIDRVAPTEPELVDLASATTDDGSPGAWVIEYAPSHDLAVDGSTGPPVTWYKLDRRLGDGAFRTVTAGPCHRDVCELLDRGPVPEDVMATYRVVAVDRAGNESWPATGAAGTWSAPPEETGTAR